MKFVVYRVYKYKTGVVATDTLDGYAKHTPSFFSYKGYDRLYKFFNSLGLCCINKFHPHTC